MAKVNKHHHHFFSSYLLLPPSIFTFGTISESSVMENVNARKLLLQVLQVVHSHWITEKFMKEIKSEISLTPLFCEFLHGWRCSIQPSKCQMLYLKAREKMYLVTIQAEFSRGKSKEKVIWKGVCGNAFYDFLLFRVTDLDENLARVANERSHSKAHKNSVLWCQKVFLRYQIKSKKI